MPNNVTNFLSVARFGKEKGHKRLLKVVRLLKRENVPSFKIHLVGDGPCYKSVEKYINKHCLQNEVVLYGSKKNPYPFFKKADCFILMSYNEAAPMVIGECVSLKLPIISTETISAKEMINGFGVVCDNSKEGIKNAIKNFLIEKEKKYDNFSENLTKQDFKNLINEVLR